MRIAGREAAAVVDAGVVAIAADPAGDHDRAGGRGANRRPGGDGDVDALVHAPPAPAEARDDRSVDRPDQTARAVLDRPGRQRGRRLAGLELRLDLGLQVGEVAMELALMTADPGKRARARAARREQLPLAASTAVPSSGRRRLSAAIRVP